jgi:pimeloyl-ACP methyl ester carboxylesterase
MNENKVVVEGLIANYRSLNNGKKAILLLHGWGDNSATFDGLISKVKGDYSFYSLDLPGFGQTELPKETWGLDEYARFVGSFIKKINIHPFCLVGHSNGGAILVRGLASGSITGDKLILIASAGVRGEYKGRVKVLRIVTKAGKLVSAPLPKSTKNKLRRKVYDRVGSDMLVAENLQETFKRIVEDDVRDDAKNLELDSLLIYGNQDKATPVSFGKILSENIKNSHLEVLNDAGHFVHKDNEDETARLIEDFIK